ncbi:MAG: patatin-like phospholipase family protein [Candidatus Nanohaloarchaea archaeon]|nr:patatin-like phospholipase family protein [Candidatus Nanohaloarchaea archaeon]
MYKENLGEGPIEKLAVVGESGGAQTAYNRGAMQVLQDRGITADYYVGSSGSAPNVSYLMTGQLDPEYPIWLGRVAEGEDWSLSEFYSRLRDIFNGKKRGFFGIDRLVDEVFSDECKLDLEKMRESDSEIIVPLTNARTGEPEYFRESRYEDPSKFYNNYMEILRAAMAEPIGYGGSVEIDGERYFDGAFGNPLPIDIEEVEDSTLLLVRTKTEGGEKGEEYGISHKLAKLYRSIGKRMGEDSEPGVSLALSKEAKRAEEQQRKLERRKERGDIIVVQPDEEISKLKNDRKSLEESIEKGRSDMEEVVDILEEKLK